MSFDDVINELKAKQTDKMIESDLVIIEKKCKPKKLPVVKKPTSFIDELNKRCSLIHASQLMEQLDNVRQITKTDKIYNITYLDNSTYVGTLTENNKYQQGKLTYSTGYSCEGFFTNEMLNGVGKICDVDGSTYEGTFVGGVLNGDGKFCSPNEIYEGHFVDGYFDGKGKYTKDGDVYDGLFTNGDFIKGQCICKNGVVYEGSFKYGDIVESKEITFVSKNKVIGKFDDLTEQSMVIVNRDMDTWICEEVLYWIKCNHNKYYHIFYNAFLLHDITGFLFKMLNEGDFVSLDVPRFHLRILLDKRDKFLTKWW